MIVFHPANVGMNVVHVQELLLQEGGGGGTLETVLCPQESLSEKHTKPGFKGTNQKIKRQVP